MITSKQLRGLSLEWAEIFGKPSLITDICMVCGRPATNHHHIVPKGKARTFVLRGEYGTWVLKTPLVSLCGSGTTGCHNDFHGGARYKLRWKWRKKSFERMWWSGELLLRIDPYSNELFRYGYYELISNGKVVKTFGMECENGD